jgi:hypothetical protein
MSVDPAFLAKISLFAPLDDDERAILSDLTFEPSTGLRLQTVGEPFPRLGECWSREPEGMCTRSFSRLLAGKGTVERSRHAWNLSLEVNVGLPGKRKP